MSKIRIPPIPSARRLGAIVLAYLPALLLMGYVALTHLAIEMRADRLALLALSLLLVLVLLSPLRRGAVWAYLVVATAVIFSGCFTETPWARVVLLLPPVLVNIGFGLLFGHTLFKGSTPLVERFINALHREPMKDPNVLSYARKVTVLWACVFALNAITCIALALLMRPGGLLYMAGVSLSMAVPVWVWSFYAHVGCYLLVSTTFLAEYYVRSCRFPSQPYRNFFDFMVQTTMVSTQVFGTIFNSADTSRNSKR